jgi:peroxiredoxin
MNRILSILSVAILLVACGKKSNFTITGKIEGGSGKTIYLNHLLNNSQVSSDSAKMDNNGSFKLKGKVSAPTFYLLKVSETNFVTILPDSAENLTISGSYKNFSRDYDVKGSDNSSKVRDLTLRFSEVKPKLDSLRQLYQKYQGNAGYTTDLERWNSEYVQRFNDYTTYLNDFVKRNPFSMACVYALYQKWDENNFVANDFQSMRSAASALYAIYPKNEQVKALYNNTLNLLRQQSSSKLNDLISQKAVNSLNITLPDVSGIQHDLWSLHGKYVLLHFWSAKDRTSRIQNQVLVELYAKYRNRGFEIYMVSVDDDRSAWTTAISEDQLTWINVGDMKGSINALISYNIKSVPSNYLLDREGNIIGKNLQGPELNNALAKCM